jgi:hypothetical protein
MSFNGIFGELNFSGLNRSFHTIFLDEPEPNKPLHALTVHIDGGGFSVVSHNAYTTYPTPLVIAWFLHDSDKAIKYADDLAREIRKARKQNEKQAS